MMVLGMAVLGSILGNMTYYAVVRWVGPKIYNYFYEKFKSIRKSLDKAEELSKKYGNKVCLVGRLIPAVRTVVTLLAGTFKIDARSFIAYSLVGVSIWNFVFILLGYLVGMVL